MSKGIRLDTPLKSVMVYISISVILMVTLIYISLTLTAEYNQQKYTDESNERIQRSIDHTINHFVDDFSFRALRLLNTTKLRELLQNNDRQGLLKLLKPKFDLMQQENSNFKVMHIHLADGTSFLRVHKPQVFGDNIAKKREMLQTIHKNHKPLSGYETGNHANVFRVINPIFDKSGKYIGAFEVGLSPNFIKEAIHEINGFCGVVFIKGKELALSKIKSGVLIDGYMLQTSLNKKLEDICKVFNKINKLEENIKFNVGDQTYLTHLVAIKNFKDEDSVKIIFFQNITQKSILLNPIQLYIIPAILIVLLLTIWFIYTLIKNYQDRVTFLHNRHFKELEELSQSLKYAVEGTNDGLWDWNLEKKTVYFSPRWKSMLGFEDNELENSFSTWKSILHPDDLEQALKDIELAHTDPEYKYNTIHRLKHKDGHWVWILDRGKTIFDENLKAVRMVGFHTDITDIKELELQVIEKEEMMISQSRHAAMGEMISMIAHQWRQPISVIAMDANNILADIELESVDETTLQKVSEDIIRQTQELSKTIDDFRNFFKPDRLPEEIKLKTIFDDTLSVIGKSLENNDIALILNIEENIELKTYSRDLMQVLINILKNAKEVLVEKNIAQKEIIVFANKSEDQLIIKISDNAGGIDKKVLSKIFEPYFTTKGEKNGTGLGLYMSQVITQKHLGGELKAYNIASNAVFEITIPLKVETVNDIS
ncbi:MAG: PAS domain-containing protein [Helicobacteraceae bacterium]|nr:PAS domain-containing protein [Helicobacteraceae bacterium]